MPQQVNNGFQKDYGLVQKSLKLIIPSTGSLDQHILDLSSLYQQSQKVTWQRRPNYRLQALLYFLTDGVSTYEVLILLVFDHTVIMFLFFLPIPSCNLLILRLCFMPMGVTTECCIYGPFSKNNRVEVHYSYPKTNTGTLYVIYVIYVVVVHFLIIDHQTRMCQACVLQP